MHGNLNDASCARRQQLCLVNRNEISAAQNNFIKILRDKTTTRAQLSDVHLGCIFARAENALSLSVSSGGRDVSVTGSKFRVKIYRELSPVPGAPREPGRSLFEKMLMTRSVAERRLMKNFRRHVRFSATFFSDVL